MHTAGGRLVAEVEIVDNYARGDADAVDAVVPRHGLLPAVLLHFLDDDEVLGDAIEPVPAAFRFRVDHVVVVDIHVHGHGAADGIVLAVVQLDGPIVEPGFIGGAVAVAVEVVPLAPVNLAPFSVAEIGAVMELARVERDVVGAGARERLQPAVPANFGDDIDAGVQAGDAVEAGFGNRVDIVTVVEVDVHGDGGGDDAATGAAHFDGPAVEAGFVGVVAAVVVEVVPLLAMDFSAWLVAEMQASDGLVLGESYLMAAAARIGLLPAVLDNFGDGVAAGGQSLEPVPTGLGFGLDRVVVVEVHLHRLCRRDDVAIGVAHLNGPAVDPGFTDVAFAVAIEVCPLAAMDGGVDPAVGEVFGIDQAPGPNGDEVDAVTVRRGLGPAGLRAFLEYIGAGLHAGDAVEAQLLVIDLAVLVQVFAAGNGTGDEIATAVVYADGPAGQPVLVVLLQAVAVEVFVLHADNFSGTAAVAEVDMFDHLSIGNRQGVGAGRRRRLFPAVLRHLGDGVGVALLQQEVVQPGLCFRFDSAAVVQVDTVRDGRVDDVAVGIEQLDGPAVEPDFIGVAIAVAVEVFKFLAADFSFTSLRRGD